MSSADSVMSRGGSPQNNRADNLQIGNETGTIKPIDWFELFSELLDQVNGPAKRSVMQTKEGDHGGQRSIDFDGSDINLWDNGMGGDMGQGLHVEMNAGSDGGGEDKLDIVTKLLAAGESCLW